MLEPPTPEWAAHLPAGAAAASIDVLREESLPKAWRARWLERPREVALVDAASGTALTAEELEERSRAVACRLSGAGLEPGDRLLVFAGTSVDLVVLHVAAQRLGLVVVPVNPTYGARELRPITSSTAPAAAVVDDSARARAVEEVQPGITVVGCDVAVAPAPEPVLDQADRATPAIIGHTSGTTGAPKGAVLTSGNLLASVEGLRTAWRWTPDDRLVLTLPLFHIHGLGLGIIGSLVAGASIVLHDHFRVDTLAQSIQDHGATLFFGVPTMYYRLAESPDVTCLRALRLCVSGSAALPASVHERIGDASGQRILERYGMTETVMNLSNPYDGERRAGTVGFPLPGVEVRLTDVGDDGSGEVQIRGPNVFGEYWRRPDATAAAFTADGWFHTGDLGTRDADGYYRIVGRAKDLIISGGYNIHPREVEDVLRAHDAVADVAVVGRPSEEWGETVVAVVVPASTVEAEDLLAFAAAQLAPYKRPREVCFVEELPRNALGKVLRDELVRSLSPKSAPEAGSLSRTLKGQMAREPSRGE